MTKIYQYEVGVLLDKNNEEYEAYSDVWDKKHGYYNEDWGIELKLDNAKDYVKNADEFNKEKVTKKYARGLDKKMRDLGREDDLEAINDERYKNEKKAEREHKDFLKHNSVLNLGRNSIRIR